MKFIYQVLATVILLACDVAFSETGKYVGTTFSGPNPSSGTEESDLDLVGQSVLSVTITKDLSSIALEILGMTGFKETLHHGGFRGEGTTITLTRDELITGIEAHWGSRLGQKTTYIKYIKLTTSSGNSISGGAPTNNIGIDNAKEGYQLGGFVVTRSGGDFATVAAIWTEIPEYGFDISVTEAENL